MTINITLNEVLQRCNNWENFCKTQGYSKYTVASGGGNIEITLTEEEAIEYELIKQ